MHGDAEQMDFTRNDPKMLVRNDRHVCISLPGIRRPYHFEKSPGMSQLLHEHLTCPRSGKTESFECEHIVEVLWLHGD